MNAAANLKKTPFSPAYYHWMQRRKICNTLIKDEGVSIEAAIQV